MVSISEKVPRASLESLDPHMIITQTPQSLHEGSLNVLEDWSSQSCTLQRSSGFSTCVLLCSSLPLIPWVLSSYRTKTQHTCSPHSSFPVTHLGHHCRPFRICECHCSMVSYSCMHEVLTCWDSFTEPSTMSSRFTSAAECVRIASLSRSFICHSMDRTHGAYPAPVDGHLK